MGLKKKQKNVQVKEQKSAVDEVFDRRKRIKADFSFRKAKPLLFIAAVIVGFITVALVYYYSPTSKIKAISAKGNYYLETDYVKELSGLTLENRYYLTFDYFIEKEIEKCEMVKNATVKHKEQGVIEIVIEEEEPFGYRYDEKGELLLKSGKAIELKSEFLDIIADVPYVEGFDTDELLVRLAKGFQNVNRDMIEIMSEITRYPMSYDENTIQIFMHDGNYFFASFYSLETINVYQQIASDLTEKGVCIYSDDGLTVAYTSTCPWNQIVEEKEYWVDELGNIVINQYGDPVEKKYYTDGKGNYVLDKEGNKILIPIDGEDNYEEAVNQNKQE
ncbi:MAG: cell division protein FtsQ/DivIB [Anaerorhabdus sp.]|uniref:cell division protein FtsQ/DivIB n=1 Tax=Anaerorhabdus sp. TaxID=1872524 RepID=UPI003A8750F3